MKGILLIAIFTAIVVASWIGFGVYHNITTTTVAPDLRIKINPIQGNFDLETVSELKRRTTIRVNLSEPIDIISIDSKGRTRVSSSSAENSINAIPDQVATDTPGFNEQL